MKLGSRDFLRLLIRNMNINDLSLELLLNSAYTMKYSYPILYFLISKLRQDIFLHPTRPASEGCRGSNVWQNISGRQLVSGKLINQ